MMSLQRVGSRVARCAAVALGFLSLQVCAEALPENDVKAGFVLNFIRYSEGMQPIGGELRVCAVGPSPLDGKLLGLSGRGTDFGTVVVIAPSSERDWRECQVVFVGSGDRAGPALAALSNRQVLTIGDSAGFAQAGGMIEIRLRSGRVRFAVNHGAIKHAGLRVSSQLLKLADEVYP